MKKLFITFCIFILLIYFYLMIINTTNVVNVNVINSNWIDTNSVANWISTNGYYTKITSISLLLFITLAMGLFIGAGTIFMFLNVQKDKTEAYKRELEKTSISGTQNASRVEVLEAKIETLEKAFNTVIDERTKLQLEIKNLNIELDSIKKNK